MRDACAICHRDHVGSLTPRNKKNENKLPLIITIQNEISGMSRAYRLIDSIIICIDCQDDFYKRLKKFFIKNNVKPRYTDYELDYVLGQITDSRD